MPTSSKINGMSSDQEVEPDSVYSGVEQRACHAPMANQGYMIMGYDGTCSQWEDPAYLVPHDRVKSPRFAVQADDAFSYSMPSHITCAHGQDMPIEDQSSQNSYLRSAGHAQRKVSRLSETMPGDSCNVNPGAEDLQAGPKFVQVRGTRASSSTDGLFSHSQCLKPVKPVAKLETKSSVMPIESKTCHLTSSDFSGRSVMPSKATQMHPCIQTGIPQGYHHSSRISSHYQQQGSAFTRNTFSASRSMYPTVNDNFRFQTREKSNLHRSYGIPNELLRGPRANGPKAPSSSASRNILNSYLQIDSCNKSDFPVKYEHANFYMIKSYSEDDIHKSIKYSVWASTPNGNNKLDAAFRKAELEKIEKGIQSPIFLFFSVNASGQFVGLAEMIGPVDFKKSMNFWQQDKWNGFFPVKWHIIKDIPNKLFQHITLEYNDNKAVTFSRDTQEIKLPQGLSMLRIFKAYQPATSILDDFDFYEEKEKLLLSKRSNHLSLMPSNVNSVDASSMLNLECSFGNMSVSADARKPYVPQKYPLGNISRRSTVNNHFPVNRS